MLHVCTGLFSQFVVCGIKSHPLVRNPSLLWKSFSDKTLFVVELGCGWWWTPVGAWFYFGSFSREKKSHLHVKSEFGDGERVAGETVWNLFKVSVRDCTSTPCNHTFPIFVLFKYSRSVTITSLVQARVETYIKAAAAQMQFFLDLQNQINKSSHTFCDLCLIPI